MAELDHLSVEQLHDAIDELDDTRAVQWIIVAISSNDGVTQQTLADRHGVSRKTVYSWMERFSPGSLDETTIPQAATDEDRPGRPRRLANTQQNELEPIAVRTTDRGGDRRAGVDAGAPPAPPS